MCRQYCVCICLWRAFSFLFFLLSFEVCVCVCVCVFVCLMRGWSGVEGMVKSTVDKEGGEEEEGRKRGRRRKEKRREKKRGWRSGRRKKELVEVWREKVTKQGKWLVLFVVWWWMTRGRRTALCSLTRPVCFVVVRCMRPGGIHRIANSEVQFDNTKQELGKRGGGRKDEDAPLDKDTKSRKQVKECL